MSFFKNIWNYIKSIFLILGLIFLLMIGIVLVVFIFKGKIYIEVVVVFILFYMFLFWKIWFSYSKKKLIKNYDPEDDKARKCEDEINDGKKNKNRKEASGRNSKVEGREAESPTSTTSNVGLEQPSRQGLLQTTNPNNAGEIGKGNRVSMPVRKSKKRLTKSGRRRFG